MHRILMFLVVLVCALAAFYGVAWFAKRQMGFWFWQSGPSDPPVTRGGASGPTQPPK